MNNNEYDDGSVINKDTPLSIFASKSYINGRCGLVFKAMFSEFAYDAIVKVKSSSIEKLSDDVICVKIKAEGIDNRGFIYFLDFEVEADNYTDANEIIADIEIGNLYQVKDIC